MMMIAGLSVVAILASFAAFTAVGVWLIERAHRPAGVFVPVSGGRLHVVELGPQGGDDPPVVLLHGASGNLEDQRLILGNRLAATRRVILIDRPGHGFSDRPGGAADASPGRQAALVAQALAGRGIARAIIVGHSWSGALAAAYALNYPDRVAGLMLLAPVTHPWPGGISWYNDIAALPVIAQLFARTIVLPLGLCLIGRAVAQVFAPQAAPERYLRRAASLLVLRPAEFIANAQDLAALENFVAAQVPHYPAIAAPTVIITGDRDRTVSPRIHARAVAALIPNAKLIELAGVGHMLPHVAPAAIIAAIDELAARGNPERI
ncbi:MAG TPA: alpha/beta fold hydrolase [Xanthobacteraceae bacterium]|jgi:pimeloyl-ACP methyl ester carboxylesterase|nr:alpha/beta fold hydrolase [Xanthobacteraceae bacterium]